MRITITDVLQPPVGGTWITYSSDCGAGTAHWVSNGHSPVRGRSYHVEFDIDAPLEASMVAQANDPARHGFSRLADDTLIIGVLESVDEDAVGCLRISSDCIIMVESRLDASLIGKPLSIRLNTDQLRATPVGL